MKYLKKYKIFESKSNTKDQRIQLIKNAIKYNHDDDSINVYNDLDISDALIYDDNNSTELRNLYTDNLTYADYDDESEGEEEEYGEYEKLSTDTIEQIITAIKKLYDSDYWFFNWDHIPENNKKDYNSFIMYLDTYVTRDINDYPDSYEEYIRNNNLKKYKI